MQYRQDGENNLQALAVVRWEMQGPGQGRWKRDGTKTQNLLMSGLVGRNRLILESSPSDPVHGGDGYRDGKAKG